MWQAAVIFAFAAISGIDCWAKKTYKVQVVTSDDLWAGTDATVRINFKGNSERVTSTSKELWNPLNEDVREDLFDVGNVDHFTFVAWDIGEPVQMMLYVGNEGSHAGWKLKSVTLYDVTDDMSYFFWINGELRNNYRYEIKRNSKAKGDHRDHWFRYYD